MARLQPDADVFAGAAEAHVPIIDDSKEEKKLSLDDANVSPDHTVHNGIHDGLILATEEELQTLHHIPDRIPWTAYRTMIMVSFTCNYSQARTSHCPH